MKGRIDNVGLIATALVAALALGLLAPTQVRAKKEFFEAARKKYGKQIKGCKHCHVKVLPSEDSHELNPRGSWLQQRKNKRKSETVDITWLEDYPEPTPSSPPTRE